MKDLIAITSTSTPWFPVWWHHGSRARCRGLWCVSGPGPRVNGQGAGTGGLIASNNGETADIITHPKLTDSGQLRSHLWYRGFHNLYQRFMTGDCPPPLPRLRVWPDLTNINFLARTGELWQVVVVNLFSPIMHNIEQGRTLVIL